MAAEVRLGCTACGVTFPREAATETGGRIACPVCGCSAVRKVPAAHAAVRGRVTARCTACGATFPREDAATEVQGVLACPECGESSSLSTIDSPSESA